VLEKAEKPVDPTRERILDAALDLFGERGPSGTTVRDIAKRANVNVAAISYHFGGKDELYRAVATHVTGLIHGRVMAGAGRYLSTLPASPAAAFEALQALLETIVDVIVGPEEMRRVARFILREQMEPTEAFEIFYGTLSRLHLAACRFLGMAAGVDSESDDTKMRVFLLIGQVIFLRVAEAAVRRRLDMGGYDAAFLAEVKALVRQNARSAVEAARKAKP
jgi:TetR/AcrR family transcriptional regulator, regulator of cefoperazone and chloramphenicol sensitivity